MSDIYVKERYAYKSVSAVLSPFKFGFNIL